jgi:hypothetical protein
MVSHKLAIQQFKTANVKPRNQPCQSNLGSIGHPRKHAFAEERASQYKSIKPTHKAAFRPTFNAVRPAKAVQPAKGLLDVRVNPGVLPIGLRLSTCANDLRKGSIGSYNKPVLPNCFGKRL